jgi:enterobactin synthetase component D
LSLTCIDQSPPPLPIAPGARLHACRFGWQGSSLSRFDAGVFGSVHLAHSLRDAVPKRQAEFLAGRYCVRRAEQALNGQCSDITVGIDRAPVWPPGLAGSISHVEGYALAVVCESHNGRSIGVDVERLSEQIEPAEVLQQVASPKELACLTHHLDLAQAFILMFSAKEAIYKALYPSVRRYIDFDEVVCIDADDSHLLFETKPSLSPNLRLRVSYALHDNLVFTLCDLDPGAPTP